MHVLVKCVLQVELRGMKESIICEYWLNGRKIRSRHTFHVIILMRYQENALAEYTIIICNHVHTLHLVHLYWDYLSGGDKWICQLPVIRTHLLTHSLTHSHTHSHTHTLTHLVHVSVCAVAGA
jgi:hypothetical protein